MQYPGNPGTQPITVATLGSAAANTLNMIVEMYLPALASLDPKWMHLKCWKAAGRWGRWIKHPGGHVKCDHCGKAIANRGNDG